MALPRRLAALSAILLLSLPLHAQGQGQIITGAAAAVDGDSLEMTGVSIRLHGADAPEAKQTCQRGAEAWACGQDAKVLLSQLVAGKQVRCEQRDRDKYGRVVAACFVGRLDLAQTMVSNGLAITLPDFSTAYIEPEARARRLKLGLWGSVFDKPADWRAAHPRHETVPAPAIPRVHRGVSARLTPPTSRHDYGCAIKGNRSRRGEWIYHVPGMPYYATTRAEEMFCSEAQARAAGYRRAIVRR
jgi:endonuclease YncB( thermonuclease family)